MRSVILMIGIALNAPAADLPAGAWADRQLVKLLDVKTIFVDSLGGEEAGSFRDLLRGFGR